MRILGFGTYDTRTHPRVGVLLEGLRRRGNTIVELDRPLNIGTAGRVEALSHPGALVRFGATLVGRWASLAAGSARQRGSHRPDAVLVGYMGHFDVLLARALYPRTRILLDHLIFAADTAKDRGAGGGALLAVLRGLDRAALRAADVVVVDTPAHRDMVPADLRAKAVVVLVGAPDAWFAARRPEPVGSAGPLSVVFFGLFTPLQGAPAIAEGLRDAARRRRIRITMVGTGQDVEECRRILDGTQVEWLDWVDAEDLPALVAAHEVCLGIMGTTPKARRVVPNKVYQGMAAGCCVITSDTPAQREVLGDAVLWCAPGDAEALSRHLIELSDDRELLAAMRRRAADLADHAFRADQVIAPLVEVLR